MKVANLLLIVPHLLILLHSTSEASSSLTLEPLSLVKSKSYTKSFTQTSNRDKQTHHKSASILSSEKIRKTKAFHKQNIMRGGEAGQQEYSKIRHAIFPIYGNHEVRHFGLSYFLFIHFIIDNIVLIDTFVYLLVGD